jgi:circadian clock protein KaiC
MNSQVNAVPARASTGIEGLDDVLGGGLPRHRLYLVQGDPGVGKTTAALQFLLAGAENGEAGIYVTLSETKEELEAVAVSHGFSLDRITIYELAVSEDASQDDYTLFHPSEIELSETTRGVLDSVERIKPNRVVFDSLSEVRLLARDALRYRRQILSLKQFFIGRDCTVLLLDDRSSGPTDLQLESLAHGVLDLEHLAPEYGAERRRLRIKKMRGVRFRGGYHDFSIITGGLRVFPRLVAAEHHETFPAEQVGSGVASLDQLLGGGLERGSSALVVGPIGCGKSSLTLQYALAAVQRGERAACFLFEERRSTFVTRARGFGWDIDAAVQSDRLRLQQIDPAELSPGEFAHIVRRQVEDEKARIVVVDSLNGYLNAMPGEGHLSLHLHELLAYLNQRGVISLLVMAQHGFLGAMHTPVDVSYLADAVILLRYFESEGAIRQAISVVKKRAGSHERTIREFRLGAGGIHVGAPLRQVHGVLTGTPEHRGSTVALMPDEDGRA